MKSGIPGQWSTGIYEKDIKMDTILLNKFKEVKAFESIRVGFFSSTEHSGLRGGFSRDLWLHSGMYPAISCLRITEYLVVSANTSSVHNPI